MPLCMKFSPATQRKFISVKSKAVCDQKPRAFDRELSLKQSQSPTGLADQGHAHSLFCGQGDILAFSGKSQSSADHENPEVLEPFSDWRRKQEPSSNVCLRFTKM